MTNRVVRFVTGPRYKQTRKWEGPCIPCCVMSHRLPRCSLWQARRAQRSSPLIGGESYTLERPGFSFDGGQTFIDSFISEENQINDVGLYAHFTAPAAPPVPVSEPVPLSLLASGLFGAISFKRCRRRVDLRSRETLRRQES